MRQQVLVLRVLAPPTCLQLHIYWAWHYRLTYFYVTLL